MQVIYKRGVVISNAVSLTIGTSLVCSNQNITHRKKEAHPLEVDSR